ncbi:MAG: hypothetical protein P8099_09105 [Gemmatimonadota bacterium]|jgi:hypothetical protein
MTAPTAHSTRRPSHGRFAVFALAALCSGLIGCGFVMSVAPVVPESDAVPLPGLVGTWYATDGSRATVTARGGREYDIATVDSDGTPGEFRARAGHLGDRLVLDVWSNPPGDVENTLISGHVLLFLELEGDDLREASFDADSLANALRTRALRTPFVEPESTMSKNLPILTAPTHSLRAALASYMQRPGAVEEPNLLRRRSAAVDSTGSPPHRK